MTYCSKTCVGRLPNLFIWHTCTILNTCIFCWIPKIILATLTRGSLVPFIASKMIFKSHSKTAFQMPTSHAKWHLFQSLRFCLKRMVGENSYLSPRPLLSWTRITALIPKDCIDLNTATSTLTLYHACHFPRIIYIEAKMGICPFRSK